jgi:hypothetical protein
MNGSSLHSEEKFNDSVISVCPISNWKLVNVLFLFDGFEPQEQFFSYLAAVTMTGDRASNLDLYVA